MIEKFSDLGLKKEDSREDLDSKIQDKLGLSFKQMKESICLYIKENYQSIAEKMINIAPMGNYDYLIEDEDKILSFIKNEVSKEEYWKIHEIYLTEDNYINFIFSTSAVDQGDSLFGYVSVNFVGKILHCFCVGDR